MKKILLTGATGFLGKSIAQELVQQAVSFIRLGRTAENDIRVDLSERTFVLAANSVDTVIHCAGLAHQIPKTEEQILAFKKSHLDGIKNLISSLKLQKINNFIFISTVAVYGLDHGKAITEEHLTYPQTPYGLYKLEAEQYLIDWAKNQKVNYWIFRLPLIYGDLPPGNLNRLIQAIRKKMYFFISDVNPRKSIVHVQDVSKFVVNRCRSITKENSGIYHLTDGRHPRLNEIILDLIKKYNTGFAPLTLPYKVLKFLAKIGDFIPFSPLNSLRLKKLSNELTFSDEKARRMIEWNGQSIFR